VRPKIRRELQNFINRPLRSECEINFSSNFSIYLRPTDRCYSTFFVLSGGFDCDQCVWVISEMRENIHLCISDKIRIIDRGKFTKWWLLLVDRTGSGFDHEDYMSLREVMPLGYSFDRIALINPSNHREAYELYP
jgi:hypothetical protein